MERLLAPEGSGHGGQRDGFHAQLAGKDFDFNLVIFHDAKVTGRQIAEAAGKRPAEDYIVLHHLESGEIESLRPDELVNLRPDGEEQFFVIKADRSYRFVVDGLSLEWVRYVTGLAIKRLGRKDEDAELLLELEDSPDRVIEDGEVVDLDEHGVERFKTRVHHGPLIIIVDGEPFEAPSRIMTPNEIIRQAAQKDPANFYLMQITPDGPVNYKDKGDEPIRLRRGMRFQVIAIGPTPVSDPQRTTGVKLFLDGLRQLGFEPTALKDHPDHVAFDYTVESGRFEGNVVKLGIIVSGDFPMTPPGGIHVSPEIHPIKSGGDHPLGGILKRDTGFEKGVGGSWQYWSRPFPDWPASKRTLGAYMAHVWKLWDAQ
jgi:hypothetical protein